MIVSILTGALTSAQIYEEGLTKQAPCKAAGRTVSHLDDDFQDDVAAMRVVKGAEAISEEKNNPISWQFGNQSPMQKRRRRTDGAKGSPKISPKAITMRTNIE